MHHYMYVTYKSKGIHPSKVTVNRLYIKIYVNNPVYTVNCSIVAYCITVHCTFLYNLVNYCM